MGYTQDKRYLILLTIDGRQAGYSDGATEIETAQWLLALGAYDAINLDGGGSTTMALSDGQGGAMVVNQTIHGGIPGQERPVASHFGIYAPRLKTSIGVVGAPPFPRLNLTPVGPGFPRLAITGVPGQLFRLQYTDSLCYPYWRNLGSGQISPFGGFEYLDPAVPQTRFYRAVLLPNP
jgi:hypothetical protein